MKEKKKILGTHFLKAKAALANKKRSSGDNSQSGEDPRCVRSTAYARSGHSARR